MIAFEYHIGDMELTEQLASTLTSFLVPKFVDEVLFEDDTTYTELIFRQNQNTILRIVNENGNCYARAYSDSNSYASCTLNANSTISLYTTSNAVAIAMDASQNGAKMGGCIILTVDTSNTTTVILPSTAYSSTVSGENLILNQSTYSITKYGFSIVGDTQNRRYIQRCNIYDKLLLVPFSVGVNSQQQVVYTDHVLYAVNYVNTTIGMIELNQESYLSMGLWYLKD